MIYKTCLVLGSFFAAFSVVFGAFGAHALKGSLSQYYLDVFETACRYQMYHAFALFVVAFSAGKASEVWLQASGVLFVLGTLLFSGSLYMLVLTKVKVLGAVTPLGGLCLILAWFCLAASYLVS